MRRALPLALCLPGPAFAHASEGGFVLLLPTGAYIAAGVATVVLTVLLVSVLPARATERLFATRRVGRPGRRSPSRIAGTVGFLCLAALVAIGLLGPHDPKKNLLPLAVWFLLWVILPVLQAIAGDLWRHLNPWHAPARFCRRLGVRPQLHLTAAGGHAIALASYLGIAAVLLAHPAPTDPETLATMTACYWALHFVGTLLCGPRWLRRAEGLGRLFAAYAALAPVARGRIGLPGWQLLCRPPPLGAALFLVAMLGTGSFDGLNETFLWIAALGFNPLEFAGRSFTVLPNLAGLLAFVSGLALVFAMTTEAGLRLAGTTGLLRAFRSLAPALVPIAFGYHLAHYLPSALIDVQYTALALNDPSGSGADLLGLGHHHVTTGFLGTLATVRLLWIAEAFAVVSGHVLAVLVGHALALRLIGAQDRAALSQLPLAIFMVAYTLFGLWLLATPRVA